MKPGDLVYWKQWEPGYTEPIPQIGLLLEDPIGLEDGNKVYKAKVLISQNSSKIATLFNVRLDVLNETW
jgi:hypothetical protein